MSYWKRVSTESIFKHPRLQLQEDTVVLPDNTETKYLRFVNQSNYVTVIARHDGKVAFVREYSYPLDVFLLQLPEGEIKAGEAVTTSANRELREETGLEADDLVEIGTSPAHHRRSTAQQYVVVATGVRAVEKTGGDAEEQGMELVWIDEADIPSKIVAGEIIQKNALAAWAICSASLCTSS